MSAPATEEAALTIVGPAGPGGPPEPQSYARAAYGNTAPQPEPSRWLVVRADGSAVAYAGKVEYGQGIRTGLAIEVAEELRLPLDAVTVTPGTRDCNRSDALVTGVRFTESASSLPVNTLLARARCVSPLAVTTITSSETARWVMAKSAVTVPPAVSVIDCVSAAYPTRWARI